MARFYEPDLGADPDSPFARDASNKLVRRSYWLDMNDRTLVMVMVNGIGAHLTNDEKRAHLTDLKREPSDRSGMRAGDFAAGKMITASCIRTTPGSVPSTSYSVRRLNEGLCSTARLTEHVVAPVRRGDSFPDGLSSN